MRTIQLPYNEYEKIMQENALLKDKRLLAKLNKLVDLLYEEKYGLYMQDYTEDLTGYSIENNWNDEASPWDNL